MVATRVAITTMSLSTALTALGLPLFLLNSCVAARRALARGDAGAAAFVAAATALLCVLLAVVREHDEAARRRRRGRGLLLRAAAWALSAALTAMFARRVAALAPGPGVAGLVWTMAGVTVAGGFCCLFVHGCGAADDDDDVVGGRPDARQA
ncbi:unnamed protein product [Urochloa humidicola]